MRIDTKRREYLATFLRENSSGSYRACAEAADVIELDGKLILMLCNEIADFVEFAEGQEKDGKIDGCNEPGALVERCKKFLDGYCPDWRDKAFIEAA